MMHCLRLCLLTLFVLVLVASEAGARSTQTSQTANELFTRLPNGLAVYVIRDTRFPLVCRGLLPLAIRPSMSI